MSQFCSNCGNEIPEGTRFCSGCGQPVHQEQEAPEAVPDARSTASPAGPPPSSPDLPPPPQLGPPPIDIPPPPPQQRAGGGRRKWLILGGGGCALVAGLGLLLVLVLVLAATCGGDSGGGDDGGASPSGEAEPNLAQGTVTDSQGNPLPGAQIYVYGLSTEAGSQVEFTTESGADGTYSLEVPDGELQLSADKSFDYGDEQWVNYSLHPINGESDVIVFDGADGLVQDFEWRLSGLEPGGDPSTESSYYGGYITVSFTEEDIGTTPEDAAFSFVLTPTGPLADGSEGETLTFERTYAQLSGQDDDSSLETSGSLYDIPLGKYTLSGEITLPDGTAFPLELELFGDRSEALEIEFKPDGTSSGVDMVQVNAYAAGVAEGQYDTMPEPWDQ